MGPTTEADAADRLREIDIDRIVPNTQQPRKQFEEGPLDELADSIRLHGVIQPIVVQALPDNLYQLIAGERRWRAAQKAGLTKVPAILKESESQASLEIALIENLQRQDLNPMEEAQAYERLVAEFSLTQDQVASRVGKSRATVTNTLRLLRLPDEVQAWVAENKLSAGHAKALLALPDTKAILSAARKIVEGKYSVRQAEMLVSRYGKPGSPGTTQRAEPVDPNVKAAVQTLEEALGTRVTIYEHDGKGKIELHFFSLDEMHRLYEGLIKARF